MRRAGNVILADTGDATLPDLFATNALALGDITTEKDSDGVLRRVKAFRIYRHWHPLFQKAADAIWLGFGRAQNSRPAKSFCRKPERPTRSKFPWTRKTILTWPILSATNFRPASPPKAKAFTDERVWHMGIVLAAQELNLDLTECRSGFAARQNYFARRQWR